MSGSMKHIAVHGRDQDGTPYTVQFTVAEPQQTGILSILTPAGEVVQEYALTHLRKAEDGRQLTCHVSGATATLTLESGKDPPELHVTAGFFVTIFDAVYSLDRTEYQRVIEWIKGLSVGEVV